MEPKQTDEEVEMVSVEWLLNNLLYSVDGCNDDNGVIDWGELIRYKNDDSLADVVYTIQEKGFRVPICAYRYEDGWALGNGHHRVAASILLCLDQIPVFWSARSYMRTDITSTEETIPNPDDQFNNFLSQFV